MKRFIVILTLVAIACSPLMQSEASAKGIKKQQHRRHGHQRHHHLHHKK
jgi:hypothetical protein